MDRSRGPQLNLAALQRTYDDWHGRHHPDGEPDPREIKFLSWIFGLLDASPPHRILDVACGRGHFLQLAAQHGLQTCGVDLSEVAIEAARQAVPDADLQVADAEALPFEDCSFDRVTCLGSLEHLPNPAAGADEIHRVLRTDGRAVLFLPNLLFAGHLYFGLRYGTQPSEGDQAFSERFMTSGGWRHMLEGAGLNVESWHVWNYIFASRKVSPLVIRLWNLASHFVPRNASYGFAFVCTRS